MTIILSLETSTEIASVALLTPNKLFSSELQGVQTHSLGLLPAIQKLLQEADIGIEQCQLIAYGCGPGAFTGVRTACGVVQGLAFGLDIPVVPIGSLLAMAQGAYDGNAKQTDFICILDARMGEVYWAHYRNVDHLWIEIAPPELSNVDVVLAYAANYTNQSSLGDVTFILGNGIDAHHFKNNEHIQYGMPNADAIAKLALLEFNNNRFTQAENAQPLYLRNKVALTSLERAQSASKK